MARGQVGADGPAQVPYQRARLGRRRHALELARIAEGVDVCAKPRAEQAEEIEPQMPGQRAYRLRQGARDVAAGCPALYLAADHPDRLRTALTRWRLQPGGASPQNVIARVRALGRPGLAPFEVIAAALQRPPATARLARS